MLCLMCCRLEMMTVEATFPVITARIIKKVNVLLHCGWSVNIITYILLDI